MEAERELVVDWQYRTRVVVVRPINLILTLITTLCHYLLLAISFQIAFIFAFSLHLYVCLYVYSLNIPSHRQLQQMGTPTNKVGHECSNGWCQRRHTNQPIVWTEAGQALKSRQRGCRKLNNFFKTTRKKGTHLHSKFNLKLNTMHSHQGSQKYFNTAKQVQSDRSGQSGEKAVFIFNIEHPTIPYKFSILAYRAQLIANPVHLTNPDDAPPFIYKIDRFSDSHAWNLYQANPHSASKDRQFLRLI